MSHHHHDHHHEITDYNRAFAIGVLLNIAFVIVEVIYGLLADSLALIADAGHNLSDVMSLLLAWGAHWLATRPASDKRTYGFRKTTILSSLISAVVLLIALGGIAWEAIERLTTPQVVNGNIVIVVAAIGVVINTATALLFVSGQKHDLNLRGAFLHMAADAAISLGVVIAGVVILFTGWNWLDPILSLGIVVIILIGTWGLLKESLNLSIDGVPKQVDTQAIKEYLHNLDAVSDLHDLHIWALSTTENALTVHLVTPKETIDNTLIAEIQQHLKDHHHIAHATIQFENERMPNSCLLQPRHG
ncbi:MAG: cation diffusion facilitator family transporter [Hydrogenovibrio sp.]|nr:cation diffusion facilitator family transporter [Hydrogenovibrio sp.]